MDVCNRLSTWCLIHIIFISFGLNSTDGIVADPSQKSSCSSTEFRCSSGQCIDNTTLCNGAKDCNDGSDETSDQCSKVRCQSSMFRCSYGGCIDRNGQCDGRPQCADSSDEDSKLCGTPVKPSCKLPANPQHGSFAILNCGSDNNTPLCQKVVGTVAPDFTLLDFQCDPGYILAGRSTNPCVNGAWSQPHPTCQPDLNSSGQNSMNNSGLPSSCSSTEFRCSSGQCIDNTTLCNGAKDCSDGSDETSDQCSKVRCPQSKFQCSYGGCIDHKGRCDGQPQCADSSDEDSELCSTPVKPSCKLPDKPQHGSFAILNCASNDNSPLCQKVVGTEAPDFTLLEFQCDPGYMLSGRSSNPCISGAWSQHHPTCQPAECGRRNPNGSPLVSGGEEARVGEFPWHVGIYMLNRTGDMEQICGGSLVNLNTVVTAAHCVWSPSFKKPMDKSKFRITVGKYFRDWNIKDGEMQEHELNDIIVHKSYRGRAGFFRFDIAIVKLKIPVKLTWAVLPVCLDPNSEHEDIQLVHGNPGTIVGWGVTEKNEPSSVLITTQLPFIDYEICFDTVPETFQAYLTTDKICAGYTNGTSVCPGDSGGGLAFKYDERFYLRGIVSIGGQPRGDKKCVNNQYAAFTKISDYLPWIERHMN